MPYSSAVWILAQSDIAYLTEEEFLLVWLQLGKIVRVVSNAKAKIARMEMEKEGGTNV